ncbi:phosphopantetheinyl transferase [Cereibacter changlensis JA139]|uniref:Enterobactin synthase component D n=2 Tax=Cereibacter changlensis TaxID=402884 RepID=A0A2T4K086_9RHOB|nr:4'-phosphopantetheinyl transferase superfamily protein [Cereibacter changlensis]PTE23570.1 phosphopantetheinyl transferase [Cereibacter changlensis JA139]PZX58511.1 4'-phosphopantetheinyl transferase EntD [Cereibacter changlensis]
MTNDLAALLAAAREFLPAGVAVAACDPRDPQPPLLPGEAVRGIARRQREFSAGRAAVRLCMAELGLAPQAVPAAPDRSPLWPPGLSGSITHSATACLAALTRAPQLLGLDIEPDAPLPPEMHSLVLRPEERDCPDPLLAFSAKEAAYKAQYPVTRTLFGFEVMQIRIDPPDRFTAIFRDSIDPFAEGSRLEGRYTRTGGHLLTVVIG